MMVTETCFLQQVHIVCSGGTADRSLGTTTSKGYASDVPDYFRREVPTNLDGDSYGGIINGGRVNPVNLNGNNESSSVKKLDDLGADETPIPSPDIGCIEKVLASLSSLIEGYNPLTRRKPLIHSADYLRFQEKIHSLLQNIPLGPEVVSYYEAKCAELAKIADEKSQRLIRLNDGRKKNSK